MAITQQTITVTPSLPGAKRAQATWNSGLPAQKLIGAVVVLPTGSNALAGPAPFVRARVDAAVVTVEVTGMAGLGGPLDVLVSVDA